MWWELCGILGPQRENMDGAGGLALFATVTTRRKRNAVSSVILACAIHRHDRMQLQSPLLSLPYTHMHTWSFANTHSNHLSQNPTRRVSHTHTLLQIQVDISLSYIHICALHTCPIYCHVNTHSCYLFPSHRYPPQGMAQMLIWFVYP